MMMMTNDNLRRTCRRRPSPGRDGPRFRFRAEVAHGGGLRFDGVLEDAELRLTTTRFQKLPTLPACLALAPLLLLLLLPLFFFIRNTAVYQLN